MKLYNKEYTREEIRQRVGDIGQLAGVKPYTLKEGRMQGVDALDVKTGSGLNFTVLPGRAMDIAWMEHNGRSIGYMSKSGITNAQYYQPKGYEWLRNFYGGVLTTCGLTHVGPPEKEGVWDLGLHGRISNTPATEVSHKVAWNNDQLIISVEGNVRESVIFSENLLMNRKITSYGGENKVVIEDTIENQGYQDTPLMILYHLNLGFPVVSEDSKLVAPIIHTSPRDKEAEEGLGECMQFTKPIPDFKEEVFFHQTVGDEQGNTCVGIINELLNLGFYVKYNRNELPCFTEWKMMGQQDYVVGLEPGNCLPIGRNETKNKGDLEILKPGQRKKISIELGVLTSWEEIQGYMDYVFKILKINKK